jgi:hypothetical protein
MAAPEAPDWSTLPEELLECIGNMLQSRREAVKFRSICPTWRAALPFAKYIAPVLMLPFGPESLDGAVTFYTVADGGATTFTRNLPLLRGKKLCGSSRGWLALVDEAASVTLLNPLTGTTIELPPAVERVVGASFRLPGGDVQWERADKASFGKRRIHLPQAGRDEEEGLPPDRAVFVIASLG